MLQSTAKILRIYIERFHFNEKKFSLLTNIVQLYEISIYGLEIARGIISA